VPGFVATCYDGEECVAAPTLSPTAANAPTLQPTDASSSAVILKLVRIHGLEIVGSSSVVATLLISSLLVLHMHL